MGPPNPNASRAWYSSKPLLFFFVFASLYIFWTFEGWLGELPKFGRTCDMGEGERYVSMPAMTKNDTDAIDAMLAAEAAKAESLLSEMKGQLAEQAALAGDMQKRIEEARKAHSSSLKELERMEKASKKMETKVPSLEAKVAEAKKLNAGTLSERRALQKEVDAAAAKLDSLVGDHGAKFLQIEGMLQAADGEGGEIRQQLVAAKNQADTNAQQLSALQRDVDAAVEAQEADRQKMATYATQEDVAALQDAQCGLSDDELLSGILSERSAETVKGWIAAYQHEHADCVTHDEIVRVVRTSLEAKAADDVGMRDFALDEHNATVVMDPRFTSPPYTPSGSRYSTAVLHKIDSFIGASIVGGHVGGPGEAINQKVDKGRCFAFGTGSGNLTVRLERSIRPTAITIEHLNPAFTALGGASAPRSFKVWGYAAEAELESGPGTLLVEGEYRLEHEDGPVQVFRDLNQVSSPVAITRLEVLSNYGHEFTCLYRFRVHAEW